MSNKLKIIVSAILAAIVISLLWFVIPVTPVWTISYIFALIAIMGIALSFAVYKGKSTKVPQGHAFPITAVVYAIVSTLLSTIMVAYDYNNYHFHATWYTIIHTAIFVFFVIRVILLFAGAEHIDETRKNIEQKHNELNKDKINYWK